MADAVSAAADPRYRWNLGAVSGVELGMRLDSANPLGCTTIDMAAVRGVADQIAAAAELIDDAVGKSSGAVDF